MLLWNQAAANILDIRHKVLWEGQDMRAYQLPANIFLLVVSGSAYVHIDEHKCYLKRHHLMHAGKGMVVDIMPAKHEFSFYLIYYKAVLPAAPMARLVTNNAIRPQPFRQFYHVILPEPALLHGQVRRMYQEWQQSQNRNDGSIGGLAWLQQQLHVQTFQGRDWQKPERLHHWHTNGASPAISIDYSAQFTGNCLSRRLLRMPSPKKLLTS